MFDHSQVLTTNVAKIMIIGVGGGGGNAVETMARSGVNNVTLVAINTDVQALQRISAKKLPIGTKLTKGLGAGANPEAGKLAAEESQIEIQTLLDGVDLLFIAAGMGGGTGTGAAPVVAKIAQQMGILTVAVVTKPFKFEGTHRMKNADLGVANLKQHVDALVVVQNEQLNKDRNYSIREAFLKADEILLQGIRGITDILLENGIINLDLADVTTVMKDSGMAHMGIGSAKGPNRIIEAIRKAVYSPLLETTIQGASNIIINFRSSDELPLNDIDTGINLVRQVISPDAKIFFGLCIDEKLDDEVQVTLIATGFSGPLKSNTYFNQQTSNPVPKVEAIRQAERREGDKAINNKDVALTNRFDNNEPNNAFVASTVVDDKPAKVGTGMEIAEDKDIPPFLRKMKK